MLQTESHEQFETMDVLYQTPSTSVERALSDRYGPVIVKRCLAGISEAQRNRFLFSAELLQKFEHPNIVPVLDVLEESNLPYLVLDDNGSQDLHAYAEGFPSHQLPLETFLLIAIQLADALGVIHHAQVIHKDLHPGNVVIQPDSLKVRIIDFGLASLLSREQPVLAPPENLEGVLAYLSPEQTGRMNRALDYRTDFYTLGVTFYQLLTGQLPFTADDALGLVYAHMAVQQTPVNELRTEIPCVISNIVNKLLSKNAEDRYQSALGLKHDLERCLEALNQSAQVHEFKLGTKDISDRFRIPQILYGREQEVNRLLSQFQTASQGKPQLLAVAGYSGIGKSALVHEVHKPIAACNGLFISGKFDQFQQNTPYSALKTALKTWLNQVLRLPEIQLQLLRKQLLKDIGQNARVMIDFMAEFEPLLGALEPIPELGAQETQARFHLVFQSFIRSVTKHQSWVIFIDDLQWADRGTLNLLPELLSEPESRLLIVVAYRDNEVDDQHPAVKMLNSIERETVVLGALPQEQVAQLLVDTLYRTETEISELAQLVHKKTDGNPFFTIEFLKTLYSKQLLDFDLAEQHWCWDIEAIEAEAITDNVVELMLQKMQTLPQETQNLLQLAACVGTHFDLHTLAVISSQSYQSRSMIDVARILWPALSNGLLLQAGGDWFLGMTGEVNCRISQTPLDCTDVNEWVPECKFLHDRMLQAAYESLDDSIRSQTHLNIGRLLFRFASEPEREAQVFEIVEQLNHGIHLMDDPGERLQLAELNLLASKKAKQASVWDAALRFAKEGLELYKSQAGIDRSGVYRMLLNIKAETTFLCGFPKESSSDYESLLLLTDSPVDKASILAACLVHAIGSGEIEKGLSIGIEGMRILGVDIPRDSEALLALLECNEKEFSSLLEQNSLEDLFSWPEAESDVLLTLFTLLPNLTLCGFILGDRTLFRLFALYGINLHLKHKRSSQSLAILLACHATAKTKDENFEASYNVARLALCYLESNPHVVEASNAYNMIAGMSLYLKEPYEKVIKVHETGARVGEENGEVVRAIINSINTLFLKVSTGCNLKSLLSESASTCVSIQQRALAFPHCFVTNKFTAAMVAGDLKGNALEDSEFPKDMLALIYGSNHQVFLAHMRGLLAFWQGRWQEAYQQCLLAEKKLELFPSFSFSIDHSFLLVFLAFKLNKTDSLEFLRNRRKLQLLNEFYPSNFAHKHLLLEAEQAVLDGRSMEQVASCYELAIKSAEENSFQQYYALACELLADYMSAKGFTTFARPYYEKAYVSYQNWGAKVRIEAMANKLGYTAQRVSGVSSSGCSTAFSHGLSESLDIASLMKSSQAISGELTLQGLVSQVMTVLTENAGAQLGALIFKQEQGATVEAWLDVEAQRGEYLLHQPLNNTDHLPVSLIDLCFRTEVLVKLDDASESMNGYQDAYLLQKKPKSVLCMPMWYRDQVIGVLYLENNLASDAFTDQRLDTLQMLLAQAAISFENACLFEKVNDLNVNLEHKVEERTKELKATQAQLVEAEKMAALGELVRGVAHELNTPLGTAVTAASIVSELSEELERKFKDNSLTSSFLKDYFANIRNSGELLNSAITRTSRMVDTFKTISVDEVVDTLCDFSLNDTLVLISSQLRHSLAENGQEFLFSCVDQIQMHSYRQVLMDVIIKLVESAKQHAFENNESGLVSVTAVSASEDGQVIIDVRDNGKGMSSELLEKVFDPFTTSNRGAQENIGLGMHVVYNLVTRKLGGAITCHSEEGEGTSFVITLPKALSTLVV